MKYLTSRDLRARGWTIGLIKKYLPNPCKKQTFRWGERFFYSEKRVLHIESQEYFARAQKKAAQKSLSASERIAVRRAQRLNFLENEMPVRVTVLPLDEVVRDAIDSYNVFHAYKSQFRDYDFLPASQSSSKSFLDRITVNYIRHNLTKYEAMLFNNCGKLARAETEPIIRRRVFRAVADAYPDLRNECFEQMKRRGLLDSQTEHKETERSSQPVLDFSHK